MLLILNLSIFNFFVFGIHRLDSFRQGLDPKLTTCRNISLVNYPFCSLRRKLSNPNLVNYPFCSLRRKLSSPNFPEFFLFYFDIQIPNSPLLKTMFLPSSIKVSIDNFLSCIRTFDSESD